jgi:hypothetical protein
MLHSEDGEEWLPGAKRKPWFLFGVKEALPGKLDIPHRDDFPKYSYKDSRNRSKSHTPNRKITKESVPKIASNNTVFAPMTRGRRQQDPGVFEKNTADSHSRYVFGSSHYQRMKPLIDEKQPQREHAILPTQPALHEDTDQRLRNREKNSRRIH